MLTREIEIGRERGSHTREAMRLPTPIVEISGRDDVESASTVIVAIVLIDHDQVVRVAEGQRL